MGKENETVIQVFVVTLIYLKKHKSAQFYIKLIRFKVDEVGFGIKHPLIYFFLRSYNI